MPLETGTVPATDGAQAAPEVFSWPIRVYWEDTDASGQVFWANYLKFFERARTEWLRHLGIEQQQLREQTGGIFVVGQAQLEFFEPARLDDQLLVTAAVASSGRASLTIRQLARLAPGSARGPVLLSQALIRIGWVQAASLRPARIPNRLLEQLS
ncbi:YbgC/FadM family acyl-CoA thioesterase [Comamonas composti]|uniref:YbgC/FadM family acyl-CoA thioesterase n=1 Tax=Comamonas composti TaxID=408558 RepID=UPI000688B3B5